MADFKYVMFKVGDKFMPVIFPNELIHEEVGNDMRELIDNTMPISDGSVEIHSAGFINFYTMSTFGKSDTLKKESMVGDADVINTYPYEGGIIGAMHDLILSTSKLASVKLILDIKDD